MLLISVVCLYLGWRYYQLSRARQIIRRHVEIVTAVNDLVAKAPHGTSIEFNYDFMTMATKPDWVLSRGRLEEVCPAKVELSLDTEASDTRRVVESIADHYLNALESVDLYVHDGGSFQAMGDSVCYLGVAYDHSVSPAIVDPCVVISVIANSTEKRASIQLTLINGQSL
jgi:hypothetical protein